MAARKQELEALRAAGKWLRYLGAGGCYLWIHILTREVTALRPAEYVDEELEAQETKNHVAKAGEPSHLILRYHSARRDMPTMLRKKGRNLLHGAIECALVLRWRSTM